MDRAIADEGSTIRLPVHFVDKLRRVDAVRREEQLSWAELVAARPEGIPDLATAAELTLMAERCRPLIDLEALRRDFGEYSAWGAPSVVGSSATVRVPDYLA